MPAKDEALRREIDAVLAQNPGYGFERVAMALKINRKRARRVMRKYGLKPARRSKAPRKLLDQGLKPQPVPNRVKKLSPIWPNVIWVSDFTYICWRGRFVYVCTVLDLFTWEVLGSNIGLCHDANLVLVSIQRAVMKVSCLPTWFHSDQGSEYASTLVQDWLKTQGAMISMSYKSSPWWNGSQESFFGRFKTEFGDVDRFDTLSDLIAALYQHLQYFSESRIKTKLRMSPAEFRRAWEKRVTLLQPNTDTLC
jgi:transposase InsO family protein